jgi:dTDP-4-dehydrorhamnose reductase
MTLKKVIVLGASGIIGQHMRLCIPKDVRAVWTRRKADFLHVGMDLENDDWISLLTHEQPHAVVNLAGTNDTDAVEKDPARYHELNAVIPAQIAAFCRSHGIHFVHISSQAVFKGDRPPYHEGSPMIPVNMYGRQKVEADDRIRKLGYGWSILRPSFVIGIRPIESTGRLNPAEQILNRQKKQVSDRWFTATPAHHVAKKIWETAVGQPTGRITHITGTQCVSRYDLACVISDDFEPVSSDAFPDIAPRPINTLFINSTMHPKLEMVRLEAEFRDRENLGLVTRAKEISIFSGVDEQTCVERLSRGFGALHAEVAENFRNFEVDSDEDLLLWYQRTSAYIWELSAYHLDEGFNYSGMCRGIADSLFTRGAEDAIVLGDGIGDLTLALMRRGIDTTYHDLFDSRTAQFAMTRLYMHTDRAEGFKTLLSKNWYPPQAPAGSFDAVCAADFMEHMPNVEEWVRWIYRVLRPGGVLFAQNAFNCGSGPDGSIPMHLARNDRFEKDWDPLLSSIGFKQESSNWYIKPGVEPYQSVRSV